MSKTAKNPRKINVFGRFPGASCLLKACKVAPWRLLCGLEGLKIAALIACWLQDGLEGAKMSPSWPKLAPRWCPNGCDTFWVNTGGGFRPPILGPSWVTLGPPWRPHEQPWNLLGPSWDHPGAIFKAFSPHFHFIFTSF